MPQAPVRVVDLFAGAGGLTAGFAAASSRFRSVAAVEKDIDAAASYEASFGRGVVFAGGIHDWLQSGDMPSAVDLVVGGPPCQGFSTLGKRDVEDERNSLWEQYAETIVQLEPKVFVVENVAAFASSHQFQQFREATEPGGALASYAFDYRVLNAADYGTPQARRRAVLIGHHRDIPAPGFPEATHARSADAERLGLKPHKTVRDAFRGIPVRPDRDCVLQEDRRYSFDGKLLAGTFSRRDLHWSRTYTQLSLDRMSDIPPGGNRFDIDPTRLPACWIRHRSGSADVMGRLHANKPSVTIRTEFFKPEKGRYLHPHANRAITHYEAAILQGFPRSHKFVGSRTSIARQIGNAVPIPLGEAIARHLSIAL